MIVRSTDAGIRTIVGTIPPLSSRLAYEPNDAKSQYLRTQGLETIKAVNEMILKSDKDITVLDIHQQVVDPQTGLVKPELSWGEIAQRFPGENKFDFDDTPADLLHLNSRGQMIVAAMIAHTLFEKPIVITPPEGADIVYPN